MNLPRELLLVIPATVIVWMLILVATLRRYRIDIGPSESFADGRSRIWQVNVLDPRNYDPRGRRLLRWLVLGQLLWIGCLVGFVAVFSRRS